MLHKNISERREIERIELRQRLLDHWLEHMETHTDYVIDAIKQHLIKSPYDREFLEAPLMAEYKRVKGK